MPTTLSFKDIIDLPEWRPVANAPLAWGAGFPFVEDFRNNEDRSPLLFTINVVLSGLWAYNVKNDDWIQLVAPNMTGAIGAGQGGVMCPSQGPRGVLAAGNTISSVVLSTALPAAVGVNQLANRGDGRGFKIRIVDNVVGGSGKIEERIIVANTSGTTPTLYLDTPLSFTPATGATYEILSGRVFFLSAGAAAAGMWKYYDIATNSMSANLSITGLPTIGTETSLIALDEAHTPANRAPGEGFFGNLVATATGATSITGTVAGAESVITANEYRNFQIRIVQDTVNPTAVGQRRRITSHTAGPSAVFTVPAWTVTPSANATFVIENDSDKIILWTGTVTTTYNYNIGANTWDTTTWAVRPSANIAGTFAQHAFGIVLSTQRLSTHSSIFVFRGGNTATLDLFDISAAATGAWTADIPYGGKGQLFTTGSCSTYANSTNEGQYIYINPNATQRFMRFSLRDRVLEPYGFMRYPQSTAVVGARMAKTVFIDGATKIAFILVGRSSAVETFQLMIHR